MKDGQKVTVKASAKDKDPSEASKKVGLELDKIKETKKEADGVVYKAKGSLLVTVLMAGSDLLFDSS